MSRIQQAAAVLLLGAMGCQPAMNRGPAPAPREVTVRQVLTTQALVGREVKVSGRCLDRSAPTVALGTRPLSGEAWQLEDNGAATWVIGRMPADCAEGTAAVTARVMQDTLPRMSPARWVRQYLVLR